ncbi:MAG: pilus assembly FimT family protein [Minisyncoccia bacterium]
MGNIKKNISKGFTIIEILVVIVLTIIIALIIFPNFYNKKNKSSLDLTTRQIAAILNEARNKAIAQSEDNYWGVYFENSTSTTPFYALFKSTIYSTSTALKRYTLPSLIVYNPSSIPLGSSTTVIFNKISGTVQNITSTKTIYLNLLQGNSIIATSSIIINISGLIDYN